MMVLCSFGSIIGVKAVLNIFNLVGSAVLGMPYVACVIIMNFL